jgi:hypothetical protein
MMRKYQVRFRGRGRGKSCLQEPSPLPDELDPTEPTEAFGLCDLGMGYPEIGYVSLSELESVRGPLNLPIERDLHFEADKTLSAYAAEAHRLGAIKA